MIDDTARANAARRILDDPVFAEAFDTVKAAIGRMFDAPGLTADDLQRIWTANQMLTKVRAAMIGMIETGKLVNFELQQQKKAHDRNR